MATEEEGREGTSNRESGFGIGYTQIHYTAVHPLVPDILLYIFGKFPWLVAQYCSYLVPTAQAGPAPHTEKT